MLSRINAAMAFILFLCAFLWSSCEFYEDEISHNYLPEHAEEWLMRRDWSMASIPVPGGANSIISRTVWYNPYDQVDVQEIFPELPSDPNVADRMHVLRLRITPTDCTYSEVRWGGVTRYFESDSLDFWGDSAAIEIHMKVPINCNALFHLDIGQVSEDIIPNGVLDTEDRAPLNGFVDSGEDVGLDGMAGADPNDFWDLNFNGIRDPNEPVSNDDWAYNPSNPFDVWGLNGTEGNFNDDQGRYPDTEDLDGDGFLDVEEEFFRISWLASDENYLRILNEYRWGTYVFPCTSFTAYGNPAWENARYLRFWVSNLPDTLDVQLGWINFIPVDE